MYFQRDYVLRMIEMIGGMMSRLGELLDEMERRAFLDAFARRETGLSLAAMASLSARSLTELLAPEPRLIASEALFARARLFPNELDDDVRASLARKAVRLLASLWEESLICELRAARLLEMLRFADEMAAASGERGDAGERAAGAEAPAAIAEATAAGAETPAHGAEAPDATTPDAFAPLIAPDALLPANYLQCARFFSAGGSFADAEDALYRALSLSEASAPDIAREGEALLRGMLASSDRALALGGLPRAEVLESIAEMTARWPRA